jgi:hypothetical protein
VREREREREREMLTIIPNNYLIVKMADICVQYAMLRV